MPAIATSKFRVHNAEQFLESFNETGTNQDDSISSKIYFYIGGVSPFADDANPDTPLNDTSSIEYSPWTDMYAAKRVQSADVVQVVPRHNWVLNTVYPQYDDSETALLDDDFYVMNSTYQVYKCLWNAGGSASTSEPSGTSTTEFDPGDGYIWKYMYTVSTADALKFLTNEFIPVKIDTAVSAAAIDGAVHTYKITAAGSGYTDDEYWVPLLGDGSGGLAKITVASNIISIVESSLLGEGYTSAVANISGDVYTSAPVTAPSISNGVEYVIFSAGNTDFTLIGAANSTPGTVFTASGSGTGTGIVFPTADQISGIPAGSNGVVTAIISPKNGHGHNPPEELGGKYVMMNIRLDADEQGTISVDNDFRKVGLIRDPFVKNTTTIATAINVRQTYKFTLTTNTTPFVVDDEVYVSYNGINSLATVVEWDSVNSYLYTTLPSLDRSVWDNGAIITRSANAGDTAEISAVELPDLEPYTGDVIYIENRSPISRAADQIEDVKLVIEF